MFGPWLLQGRCAWLAMVLEMWLRWILWQMSCSFQCVCSWRSRGCQWQLAADIEITGLLDHPSCLTLHDIGLLLLSTYCPSFPQANPISYDFDVIGHHPCANENDCVLQHLKACEWVTGNLWTFGIAFQLQGLSLACGSWRFVFFDDRAPLLSWLLVCETQDSLQHSIGRIGLGTNECHIASNKQTWWRFCIDQLFQKSGWRFLVAPPQGFQAQNPMSRPPISNSNGKGPFSIFNHKYRQFMIRDSLTFLVVGPQLRAQSSKWLSNLFEQLPSG